MSTHSSFTSGAPAKPGVTSKGEPPKRANRAKRWGRVVIHHLKSHTGIGAICSVAYFDPGNWSVDLQGGSQYGYKLLCVVLVAGLMAVVFQNMATRLGVVTGLDLATHCRLLLHSRQKHRMLWRWGVLYPLYALSEVAIICTDLAELLGSATALSLLFPALPLWAGVLLTASDVFVILAMSDPTQGQRNKPFEILIGGLVIAVIVCLIIVMVQVKPNMAYVMDGYLPSATIFGPGALYTSVGIIGATVMPHALYLGSSLAKQDRVGMNKNATLPAPYRSTLSERFSITSFLPSWETVIGQFRSWRVPDGEDPNVPIDAHGHAGWANKSVAFVRAHLNHSIADITISLLGFAVVINSMILVTAGAVFFYGPGKDDSGNTADLFQAHDLIKKHVGKAAGTLFALALLSAGESAGITATLAGQVVSEGYIRWHVSPFLRRAITRMLGLIPSMIVAMVLGRAGINTLLVLSQVVLSFVLPFVVFPLVYITSSSKLMRARVDDDERSETGTWQSDKKDYDPDVIVTVDNLRKDSGMQTPSTRKVEADTIETIGYLGKDKDSGASLPDDKEDGARATETVDYSNGKIMMCLGYFIWFVVLVANVYVLVTLAMGDD